MPDTNARRRSHRERLRQRLPQGTLVHGPFWLQRDEEGRASGGYDAGVGQVDWTQAHEWVVSHRGVPVRVLEGDRLDGGYEAGELRLLTKNDALRVRRTFGIDDASNLMLPSRT